MQWLLLFICLVLERLLATGKSHSWKHKSREVLIHDLPVPFMGSTDSQVLAHFIGSGKLKPVFWS